MTETTEQYRNRINQLKTEIETEPLIKEMRSDIAEGIHKTGNRQADIEKQFQDVIDNTTGKAVIAAPELIAARNGETSLKDRLDKERQQVNEQLAQTASKDALSIEKERIDNLLSIPEGSTTNDARLEDITVGVDGIQYDSPGNSVRTQINDTRKQLNGVTDSLLVRTNQANWYDGGITLPEGNEVTIPNRVRSELIQAEFGSIFKLTDKNFLFAVLEYDKKGKYIVPSDTSTVTRFTRLDKEITNPDTGFVRLVLRRVTESPITTTDASVLKISAIATKSYAVVEMQKASTTWKVEGLDLTTGESFISDTMIRSGYIRANKGTKVILKDKINFKMLVLEYKSNIPSGKLRVYSVTEYANADYEANNDIEFIRIVIKRRNDGPFSSIAESGNILIYPIINEKKVDLSYPVSFPSGYITYQNPRFNPVDYLTYEEVFNTIDNQIIPDAPNRFTKITHGLDSSGLYNTHSYMYEPILTGVSGTPNGKAVSPLDIPTITLISGIHGEEKPAVLAMINFMNSLVNDWKTNELFRFLSQNFRFNFLPVANSWGYVNNRRQNVNNVDLSRNLPAGGRWELGSDDVTGNRYRGAAPLSEKESVYIHNILSGDIGRTTFVLDLHTFGVFDSYANMTEFATSNFLPSEKVIQVGIELTKQLTSSGWINHNLPEDSGLIGHTTVIELGGNVAEHAESLGIQAATPECMYRFYGTNNDHSIDVQSMNAEYLANSVLLMIRRLLY